VQLEDVPGFVFDVDGTLVQRAGADVHALPGAKDVLDAIRASGRPLVLFTNGSHMPPASFARELRGADLPVEDDEVLTPLCSVQTYLDRRGDVSVLPFATDSARGYLEESGVRLVDGDDGSAVDAVFVAHPKGVDFESLERAARAVIAGARLLTGSYVAAYAGANGPILSRGAMVTAAIAELRKVQLRITFWMLGSMSVVEPLKMNGLVV
jgi:NagD protein